MAFYEPPARIHTQSNLLTEGKAAGGTRNKRQRLYLDWLRNLHTEKEAELRGTAEWRDGDWGSPYSRFWPSGANATALASLLQSARPWPLPRPGGGRETPGRRARSASRAGRSLAPLAVGSTSLARRLSPPQAR